MISKTQIEVGKSYSCTIKNEKVIISIRSSSYLLKNSYNFWKMCSYEAMKNRLFASTVDIFLVNNSFYIIDLLLIKPKKFASGLILEECDINKSVRFNSITNEISTVENVFAPIVLCNDGISSKWEYFSMFYRIFNLNDFAYHPSKCIFFQNIFLEKPSTFCLSKDEINSNLTLEALGLNDYNKLKSIYSILCNPDDGSAFLNKQDFSDLHLPFLLSEATKLSNHNLTEFRNKKSANPLFFPANLKNRESEWMLFINQSAFIRIDFNSTLTESQYFTHMCSWLSFLRNSVIGFEENILDLFESHSFVIYCNSFKFFESSYCPVYTIKFI